MNANIRLQGTSIVFAREDVENADGSYALLADIAAPISIPPGRFARIPTPIAIRGDGATIAVMHVAAGRDGPASDTPSGQFVVPPKDREETIVACVLNETTSTVIINPSNRIGVLELSLLGNGGHEADAERVHADHATDDLVVPVVYDPKHIDGSVRPAYATAGAAAFDLRADVDRTIHLAPGDRMAVPTGLRLAIPEGFEGQMRPRSGLALKHGITITNAPGTIDSDYRGEVMAILQNTGGGHFAIEPGDRIAQLLIAPVTRALLDFRDELDDTDRGGGGFGSTGRA